MNVLIYSIYKPTGWTSFDVVKKIRSITNEKKVGHGGTLDPFAEGLLIIATGKDTKQLANISGASKSYRAVLKLGKTTDTLDTEGQIIDTKPVPELNEKIIINVLNKFVGEYEQIPPMFSAKRVNGVRLYKLARENITVERKPIIVNINNISLNSLNGDSVDFSVTCSKGTYIRVLGQDIANKLGTVGYLIRLIREKVGKFQINDSSTIEKFESVWMSTVH
ncbi:MAG: tRNA pseudouridine(55) synthase TruB [Candidatus Marinimicrobia bacterium]|nr:tRNA pseudouridine(55) synthase TruB [Candidatus Neomarinimicrobiota bacterium]